MRNISAKLVNGLSGLFILDYKAPLPTCVSDLKLLVIILIQKGQSIGIVGDDSKQSGCFIASQFSTFNDPSQRNRLSIPQGRQRGAKYTQKA
jgi:hypothetical protein